MDAGMPDVRAWRRNGWASREDGVAGNNRGSERRLAKANSMAPTLKKYGIDLNVPK